MSHSLLLTDEIEVNPVQGLRREVSFESALPRHGVLTANSLVNGPKAVLHAQTLDRNRMQLLKSVWLEGFVIRFSARLVGNIVRASRTRFPLPFSVYLRIVIVRYEAAGMDHQASSAVDR